jgi:hypothetical protein
VRGAPGARGTLSRGLPVSRKASFKRGAGTVDNDEHRPSPGYARAGAESAWAMTGSRARSRADPVVIPPEEVPNLLVAGSSQMSYKTCRSP